MSHSGKGEEADMRKAEMDRMATTRRFIERNLLEDLQQVRERLDSMATALGDVARAASNEFDGKRPYFDAAAHIRGAIQQLEYANDDLERWRAARRPGSGA